MMDKSIWRFFSWKSFSRNRKTAQFLSVAKTLRKWGQKDREQIVALLSAGADVNARDSWGKSAMFYAQRADNKWVIKLLLEHGAHPLERAPAAAARKPDAEPVISLDGFAGETDDLVYKLSLFPRGFVETSKDATMAELAIGNLFAVQCAVQIALGNLGKIEHAENLLKAVGVRFATGLADPVVHQVARSLPKYAESFDTLSLSGVETLKATMSAIATTFEDYLRNAGVSDDKSLPLTTLMIQSCTDAIKTTVALIDEHYRNQPNEPIDGNNVSEPPSSNNWLDE